MMKKRLLSATLSGCMLLTAFPSAYAVSPVSPSGIVQSVQTYAAAGDIDENTTELKAGISYSLPNDVTLKDSLKVTGKDVTLDLNGHTLKIESGKDYTIVVGSGASLTLKDSTGANGELQSGDSSAISIEKGGFVLFKSGTIQSSAASAVTIAGSSTFRMSEGSKIETTAGKGVVVQGGTVEIAGSIKAAGTAVSGEGSGTITINKANAILESNSTAAVSLLNSTTLNVSNGKIFGVNVRAGTINVTGGVINAPSASSGKFDDGNSMDVDIGFPKLPSAISLLPGSAGNTNTGKITLNISGGEVISTATNGNGVGVYVSGGTRQATDVTITGGTIKGKDSINDKALALYYRDGNNITSNWTNLKVAISGGVFSSDPANANTNSVPTGKEKTVFAKDCSAIENNGVWEIRPATTASSITVVDTNGNSLKDAQIKIMETGTSNEVTTMIDKNQYDVTASLLNYWTSPVKTITAPPKDSDKITLTRKTGTLTVTPTLYEGEKPSAGANPPATSTTGKVTVSLFKRGSQTAVYTVECDTGKPTELTIDVGEEYKIQYTADGYAVDTSTATTSVTISDKPNEWVDQAKDQDKIQETATANLYKVRRGVTFNVTESYNGGTPTVDGAKITVKDSQGKTVDPVSPTDPTTYRLDIGTYSYDVEPPELYTYTPPAIGATITVAANSANQTIPVELTRKVKNLEVIVTLSEAVNPNPATRAADDITITLTDTATSGAIETKTISATATDKKVTFDKARVGATYTLTVSKSDYDTATRQILIADDDQTQTEDVTLYRSRGLSTLQPVNAHDKKEVPNVTVSVWEGTDNTGAKVERDPEDLTAWKFNLKSGVQYYYRVEAPYFSPVAGNVTGILSSPEVIAMKQISVPVEIKTNVQGAIITVVDKDGAAVSPTDGKYVLTIGDKYKYSVSATGYRPKKDIELTAAVDTTEINVELSPLAASYTAIFNTKTVGGKPIANATVTVYSGDTVVKTATTGLDGQCSIDDLKENSYRYTIAASAYKTTEGTIDDAFNRETDQYVISKTLEAETYQVRFVFQSGTETVNPGAALTVQDGDGSAVTPNADGTYTLKQPEVSKYTVKNDPNTFDYQTVSGTVQYNANAQGVQTVTVSLTKVAHDYQTTFKVTGQAEGVTPVVKYGEGTATTTIPATENGYVATLQNNRSYVYEVSATGYQTVSGVISPKDDRTAATIPVYLVETSKVFTLQLNLYSTDATVANPSATDTNIIMKDGEGNMVSPIGDTANRFYLDTTKTYTYTVTANGFAPKTGTVEAGTTAGMVKEELIGLTPHSRNYTLTFTVTSADGSTPNDVKITVKENETEQKIENNQVTLLNNHAYTYTVAANGKNTVSGKIDTKTDTAAETLSIVLTNTTTVPETKAVVQNADALNGGSDVEKADIVEALSQTNIPATTAAAIGAAAEKNRTAILTNAGADNQSTTLYLQTYLQIEPKTYTATADGKSLVVDIKPMVRVVDATGTPFVFHGNGGEVNAKYVGDPQPLNNVTETLKATITLPSSFVADSAKDWVYINHNAIEHTRSRMDANNQVHFMTTGFSPFTFSTKDTSGNLAYIQETGEGFTTLQAATDKVQDHQTIEVTGAGTSEATVNRVVSFYLTTPNGATVTIKDSSGTAISPLDTLYVISSAKPDDPDDPNNPGGADPDNNPTDGYRIRVSHGSHGSVSVSHSRAKSGTTVTVTIRPDAGYEMAEIEVLDDHQDSITTRRKTDEEYTFRMPDSTVTVDVSFRSYESNRSDSSDKSTVEHGGVPFPDVKRKDWFYDAVKYVYDRGIMDGKGVGFVPDAPVTRGMVVTILYRMDGKPSASESQFSDVQPGQYYSVPVSWAARHDIVNGYGNGQFRPNDSITREQFATILYRFAQYKNYSTSAAGSLLQYADASNISDFALDAMRWANGNRLITGVTETALMPTGNATRAQAAAVIQRFCKEVAYY